MELEPPVGDETKYKSQISEYKSSLFSLISILFIFVLMFLIYSIFQYLVVPRMNFKPVDKNNCKCSCFDGKIKGIYHNSNNVTYKYIYFNFEFQTYILFSLFLFGVFFYQKSIEITLNLISHSNLSYIWFIAYLSTVYPNFYGIWCIWNYINDSFFRLFIHQVFSCSCLILGLFQCHRVFNWNYVFISNEQTK
jgi:hypothetical protein